MNSKNFLIAVNVDFREHSGLEPPTMHSNRGLRSLSLVALTTIFSCAGEVVNPNEAAVVSQIQLLKGKVEFDKEGPDKQVIKVYLHSTAVQDSDLVMLNKLPKLKNLFLGKTQIGDQGLEQIADLSELVTLSLNSTKVTDIGLKSLGKLSKLKTLNLQETAVTGKGAATLRKKIPELNIAR